MELIRNYKQGKLTTSDVRNLNKIVIGLMVLVAIWSIVWSISLHMLSGDFNEGIVSAKLIFRERNFEQLDNRSKEIISHDLSKILSRAYAGLDGPSELPMPTTAASVVTTQNPAPTNDSQSKKSHPYKIEHVYESKENAPTLARRMSQEPEEPKVQTAVPEPPSILLNREADRRYLSSMSIDGHATHWSRGVSAQFVYAFPFISEIVAIVWSAMCLIFQTGSRKTGGLPKPWRIVVPSIVIFTLMSIGSVAYTIITNGYLKRLCTELRFKLFNPTAISCGDAISLLRPHISEHRLSYDVHLGLFRCSYIISTILWILALLVMVMRYVFAVDFQLVDIDDVFERKGDASNGAAIQPVYVEVQQASPQHQAPGFRASVGEMPRSEDDFQSAKSRLSEAITPLLDEPTQTVVQQKTYSPAKA